MTESERRRMELERNATLSSLNLTMAQKRQLEENMTKVVPDTASAV